MDVSLLVIGGFVLVWTIGLLVGVAYLRGGLDAVRRVVPRLSILVPILAVVIVVESVVARNVGGIAVDLVLLPVGIVILVRQIRRYRHIRATAPDEVRAAMAFTPAIRNFAIIAFLIMFAGSILVAFLSSRAGL